MRRGTSTQNGKSKQGERSYHQSRVDATKVEFKQTKFRQNAYKRVKIALIGEGQIHGEDDAISMRPYCATLRCHSHGELLALNRGLFR